MFIAVIPNTAPQSHTILHTHFSIQDNLLNVLKEVSRRFVRLCNNFYHPYDVIKYLVCLIYPFKPFKTGENMAKSLLNKINVQTCLHIQTLKLADIRFPFLSTRDIDTVLYSRNLKVVPLYYGTRDDTIIDFDGTIIV